MRGHHLITSVKLQLLTNPSSIFQLQGTIVLHFQMRTSWDRRHRLKLERSECHLSPHARCVRRAAHPSREWDLCWLNLLWPTRWGSLPAMLTSLSKHLLPPGALGATTPVCEVVVQPVTTGRIIGAP